MITLSREFRFSLIPLSQMDDREGANNWGGWPNSRVLAPFLKIRCWLSGVVDQPSGYLCNIKVVDQLLQSLATNYLIPQYGCSPWELTGDRAVNEIYHYLDSNWEGTESKNGRLCRIELQLTPTLVYAISSKDPQMVQVTQQFEFSAAHRLHCPQMSDVENRSFFGKCNNPNGHGHNYVFEVTVAGLSKHATTQSPETASASGSNPQPTSIAASTEAVDLLHLEKMVKKLVVDRLDHQHLNLDVKYFRDINPSVENIATAIYRWLDDQLSGMQLVKVKVYETPKTWAEYCRSGY